MRARCTNNRVFLEIREGRLYPAETDDALPLTIGALYEVLESDGGFLRVVDDDGEDYLYPQTMFEVLSE